MRKCFICRKTDEHTFLTKHHIIPWRKFKYYINYKINIMILCRRHHNIIDCPAKERNVSFYIEHMKVINKYNKYLIRRKFDKEHYWKLIDDYDKVYLVDYLKKNKLVDSIRIDCLQAILNM